jgi:hypothetical protein
MGREGEMEDGKGGRDGGRKGEGSNMIVLNPLQSAPMARSG